MGENKWTSVQFVSEAEEANHGNRRTMEDVHITIDNFADVEGQGLFCVFDGHGGTDIVNFLEENFAKTLAKNIAKVNSKGSSGCLKCGNAQEALTTQIQQVMIETLAEVDQASAHLKVSGSTVACCLVRRNPKGNGRTLYVANLGDTRAVLHQGGQTSRLTYDHTAEDPEEIKRIEAAGGFMLKKRILGILSVARAIGDHTMKQYVISRPYQTVVTLQGGEILIIACDGVWDVMSDEEAIDFVKKLADEEGYDQESVAAKLCAEAINRGSQDNITVLVIYL